METKGVRRAFTHQRANASLPSEAAVRAFFLVEPSWRNDSVNWIAQLEPIAGC